MKARLGGAGVIYVGALLGRRYGSSAACAGSAESKQFAATATGGRFYLEAGQVVERAGTGAGLMFHCRGEGRGLVEFAGPLVVALAKRQARAAAGDLKALRGQDALRP